MTRNNKAPQMGNRIGFGVIWACVAVALHGPQAATVSPSWSHAPHQQTEGVFWREHWYERGAEHGNPAYTRRLRISSPEVALHPSFGKRVEARENGLMLIRAEEDLFLITGAELYAEQWGGHPGTANKRFAVNGRSAYPLPRMGTEDGHCTYGYPVVPLRTDDLVNGYNAIQWLVDQGTTFWGHSLIDTACLRVALTNEHPDLKALRLAEFNASVEALSLGRDSGANSSEGEEGMRLRLLLPDSMTDRIARADFETWYFGFDENGNRSAIDWHGFTRNGEPEGHVGSAVAPPFSVNWDTSMLPAQKNVAVRARVRFKDEPDLVYVTSATGALVIEEHANASVHLYTPPDLPAPFWSRANNKKTCSFVLDVEASRIERAVLYIVTWTGGAGTVKEYFKLNGEHFPVAEGSGHQIQYSRLPVPPSLLRKGVNTVELLSDTEHHGIEVIYPGPALMVRIRR